MKMLIAIIASIIWIPAYACSCGIISLNGQVPNDYEISDLIFVGKAIEVTYLDPRENTSDQIQFHIPNVAVFVPDEIIKDKFGAFNETREVLILRPALCNTIFQKDMELSLIHI